MIVACMMRDRIRSSFEIDCRRDLRDRMFCDDKRRLQYETRHFPGK